LFGNVFPYYVIRERLQMLNRFRYDTIRYYYLQNEDSLLRVIFFDYVKKEITIKGKKIIGQSMKFYIPDLFIKPHNVRVYISVYNRFSTISLSLNTTLLANTPPGSRSCPNVITAFRTLVFEIYRNVYRLVLPHEAIQKWYFRFSVESKPLQ